MTNTRTLAATVKFYDMPDGTVETEVDMHGGYTGTNGQKKAAYAASNKCDVDELAQFIRFVNGNNELCAGKLAELIHAWLYF